MPWQLVLLIAVGASLVFQPILCSADVAPDYIRGWSTGGKPISLVVDRNSAIYVACEEGRVEKYSLDGALLRSWTASGPLNGIGVDADGNVYIAEFLTCHIKKFSSDGVLLLQWGSCASSDSTFLLASDVAVDPAGNIHALDYGGRVLVFTPNGAYVRRYSDHGSNAGYLSNPRGLTIDATGQVFIADTENYGGRIQKFTSSGQYLQLWSAMQNPFDVAVDPEGHVYVPDYRGHQILKFANDGHFLVAWGSQGSLHGQFNNPRGIATDSFGNVYVADSEAYRIQKFGYPPTPVMPTTWSRIKSRYAR